jgi:coenzyme Q-binding protein COQ10
VTTHSERQRLKYEPSQVFDLVADVERYPEFMSWVVDSRIRRRDDHNISVAMTVAFGPVRKRFTTSAVLHRPHRIDITSNDPIFDHYAQRWTFEPTTGGGTTVEHHLDFKFRSRVLQVLMAAAFADQVAATMSAFRRRAYQLYGGRP